MTDWNWLFASDYGRDKMLASEVDQLSAQAASARATNSRLSSQLASLEGSLDSRLSALSAAFDAYVELGDVREQLAAYGAEATIRRKVVATLQALAAGGRPARIAPEAEGYWLPYATNAVIALVEGRADTEAEEQARSLSHDTDLFIVVLLGALDRGALVAARVPDLLVGDGTLTPAQVALWRAVLAGVYPEPEPGGTVLIDAVGEAWRGTLATGDAKDWQRWVVEHADQDSTAQLQWVADLLQGRVLMPLSSPAADAPEAGAPAADPRSELQAVAIAVVTAGSDPERDLVQRAGELRRKIEHPRVGLALAPDPVAVRSVVRTEFETTTDPGRRAVLLGWLRPGLAQAVAAAAAQPSPQPEGIRRSLPFGSVVVGPDGPDAALLAKVRSRVVQANPRATSRPLVPALVGGVLLLLALVGLALGWPTALVVLFLLGAVAGAVAAVVAWRNRVAALRAIATDHQRIDQLVDEATRAAAEQQAEYREREAVRARLVEELRSQLEPDRATIGS
ncbi:hypothetical protein [uncultured Friedmanniella sp.]|uniref:hypothetical protein n=1 Tax=uncultured Friedmanniella sp. TaxID=335381 RepID=UPI0035CAE0F2